MNNPLPKITFIIVKKRHNTRFFIREPNPNPKIKIMNNIQPGSFKLSEKYVIHLYCIGTVVDTGIVHPQGFDFYLNSHAAIQGMLYFKKQISLISSYLLKEHHVQFYIMFYMMKLAFHLMKYNL